MEPSEAETDYLLGSPARDPLHSSSAQALKNNLYYSVMFT